MRKIDRLIERMEEARRSHEEWAEYNREHPRQTLAAFLEKYPQKYVVDMMGDTKYQVRWTRTYDSVIKVLEEVANAGN